MNPTNSKEIFAVPRHTAPHSKSRKGSSKSVNESRQNSLLLPVDISKAIDELTISPSVSRLEESHASQNENTEPQVTKTKVTKPQVTEPQKQMMVVSTLNACNINASNGALNQQNLDQAHWRQSPQTTSTENNQQDYIINCNAHDQRPTSPVQNGEDNSCYSSENGADNLSPRQENSRSSGSEDLASNLFPISGSGMMQQCMEYSNSDNESSQASPSSFQEDDYRSGKNSSSSSSKPKIHKCRQCNFSTLSKHESWLHIAIHMKPEKILRCPECPFVTEYKHHLDFHVWNHQGMKPYKCDKCPYVCVNKSMLKSHLKSHSNVYQYRCANCAYRTKYCHSLKIHLRKYRHEPGMVLDSEGNPNPNPIIDVYGNRRGPKQKSRKQDGLQQQKQQQPQQFQQQPQLQQQIQPAVPPLNAFPSFPWGVNNAFFTENSHLPCTTLLPNAFINTPFAAAAAAAAITEQAKASVDVTSHDDTINNNLKITNINNNTPSSCNNNNIIFSNNNNENSTNIDSVKPENSSDDEDVFHPDTCLEEPRSVSPSGSSYHQLIDKRPASKIHLPVEEAPLNLSVSSQTLVNAHDTNAITPVVKNRRKGVACKLKRLHTTDDEHYLKNLVCSNIKIVQDTVEEKPQSTTDCEIDAQKSTKKNSFYCHFCEITFCNQIMFTMHMGYHGYLDPFTCNRCGKKTEDKIAFYAHMISSAHL